MSIPTAARRGPSVALIVFVVLAVILGVTTYVFYSAREKERVAKEEALAETERSRRELSEANAEKAAYADATGWATAAHAQADVEAKLKTLYEVMNRWNITIDPALPPTAATLLKETERATFSISQILDFTETALGEAEAARIRADAEKQAMEDAKNAELDERIADLNQARADNIAMRERYEADIQELRDNITAITGEFETAKENWSMAERDYQMKIDVLSVRIDEMSPEIRDPQITDGKILRADLPRNFVVVDIGQKQHVRTDMEFHVFGQPGPEETIDKGIIRISNIYETQSFATIMKSYPEHPILEGDRISSPFYDPVRPQRFVITGDLKLYDLPTLTNIIKYAGGEIQSEVVPDTDYLIVGNVAVEMQVAQEQLSRARHYGVPVMTEERLLEYISHK